MKRSAKAIGIGVGIVMVFSALFRARVHAEEGFVPAEEAGWELVFTDNFEREELGEEWEIYEGTWEIKDGYLRGSGTLVSARGFPGKDPHRHWPGECPPGFIRLEFEAKTDVQPLMLIPGEEPEVSVGDLSSIIHARAPDADNSNERPTHTGYFFQFGGFHNTRNRIMRRGETIVDDKDSENKIIPDEKHSIVVENDEGHLRFFVDEKLLLEYNQKASIIGHGRDRVGLYFYTDAKVSELKVYVKRLADAYGKF